MSDTPRAETLLQTCPVPPAVIARLARTRHLEFLLEHREPTEEMLHALLDERLTVRQVAKLVTRPLPESVRDRLVNMTEFRERRSVRAGYVAGNLLSSDELESVVTFEVSAPIADRVLAQPDVTADIATKVAPAASPKIVLAASLVRPGVVTGPGVHEALVRFAKNLDDRALLPNSQLGWMAAAIRIHGLPTMTETSPWALLAAAAFARLFPVDLIPAVSERFKQMQDPWAAPMIWAHELADNPFLKTDLPVRSHSIRADSPSNMTFLDIGRLINTRPITLKGRWSGRVWTLLDLYRHAPLSDVERAQVAAQLINQEGLKISGALVTYQDQKLTDQCWADRPSEAERIRKMFESVTVSSFSTLTDNFLVWISACQQFWAPLRQLLSLPETFQHKMPLGFARPEDLMAKPVKHWHAWELGAYRWLAEQLGDSPDRWDLALSMIDTFDGTGGEFVDTIRSLADT